MPRPRRLIEIQFAMTVDDDVVRDAGEGEKAVEITLLFSGQQQMGAGQIVLGYCLLPQTLRGGIGDEVLELRNLLG